MLSVRHGLRWTKNVFSVFRVGNVGMLVEVDKKKRNIKLAGSNK